MKIPTFASAFIWIVLSLAKFDSINAFAQAPPKQQLNAWWQAQAPGAFPFRLNSKKLPLIFGVLEQHPVSPY